MAVAESGENTPTYLDLVQAISKYLQDSYNEAFVESRHTTKVDSWNITNFDIACVLVLTAALSTIRYILDNHVSMPLTRYYNLPEKSRKKVPEHLWRFTYFFCIWCYELYVVVLSGKYKFFQKPDTMWHGWSLETGPSGDIYSIQVIQIAFYLHWTYATLFLDTWRKDSAVLVFHHIFTFISMVLAKAAHCHNIAVLMHCLHDMCDVFLDFSRLCSLFHIQGLKVQQWMNIMSCVVFAFATAIWCSCRLYWYPLKAVYSAAVHPQRFDLPYGFLMNLLLWIQLILNYYWFTWLLRIAYHIMSVKTEDPRDYDNEEMCSESLCTGKKSSSGILKKKY